MSQNEQAGNSAEEMSTEGTTSSSTMMGAGGETLVVVSKVKKRIRDLSGMNTSRCAVEALSTLVDEKLKAGFARAQQAGRKTVMGKDIL